MSYLSQYLEFSCYVILQWDEDVEVSDISREYGDIEWLHHNIITQNNVDGIIVGIHLKYTFFFSHVS